MFSFSTGTILRHASRGALSAAGVLVASVQVAVAQAPAATSGSWEFRISGGSFVPTGSQRNVVKEGQVTAAQLSWLVRPSIAVSGTFSWARSRDLTMVDTPKLDVLTSDLGVEARPIRWFANAPVSMSPFVGLGAGVRTYNPRTAGDGTTNAAVGYASAGGEFGIGRVGLRLEVRDYVSNARFARTTSGMRNDVVVSAALRFNRQRADN
jgi:hypothetical protein